MDDADIIAYHVGKMKEKLQLLMESNASLESQLAARDGMVAVLKDKILAGVELLKQFRQENKDLKAELERVSRDRAIPPAYFICPIQQDVMQSPVVAADGFTYEEAAIRTWLDSGHGTSPMTNLPLQHQNLVPNHTLRSAIQEWMGSSA